MTGTGDPLRVLGEQVAQAGKLGFVGPLNDGDVRGLGHQGMVSLVPLRDQVLAARGCWVALLSGRGSHGSTHLGGFAPITVKAAFSVDAVSTPNAALTAPPHTRRVAGGQAVACPPFRSVASARLIRTHSTAWGRVYQWISRGVRDSE